MSLSIRSIIRTYSTLSKTVITEESKISPSKSISQKHKEIDHKYRYSWNELANYGGVTDEMRERAAKTAWRYNGKDDPVGY